VRSPETKKAVARKAATKKKAPTKKNAVPQPVKNVAAKGKTITKEIAQRYLKDSSSVDLSPFTDLDDEAAEVLGKSKGDLKLGVVTLSDASASPLSLSPEPELPPQAWYARFWRRPFFLIVILPSLIVALYFYAIAAPQYVSEARFVVSSRGSDGGAAAAMRGMAGASAFGGLGGGMASSETNSVRDFLSSLDAVMDANAKLDLVALWRRPEADFLAQLWDTEPELLTRFYNRMVTVSLDPSTNVTTLRVRSFRPEDSKAEWEQREYRRRPAERAGRRCEMDFFGKGGRPGGPPNHDQEPCPDLMA
jgi:hypothetical protein